MQLLCRRRGQPFRASSVQRSAARFEIGAQRWCRSCVAPQRGQILALGSRNHDLARDKNAKMDMHTHAGATRAFLLTPQ